MPERAKKVRNYSFKNSSRVPTERMTEVNGIRIPSVPGSCYHAIICSLAQNKNKFCNWDRVIESSEKYMKQYGGDYAWNKFLSKSGVKSYKQRIKDNTHTLTRTGKDCYGYRMHEQGMAIYYFRDGAILFTGGEMKKSGSTYNVIFPDGKKLQTRYRGTTMSYTEYTQFLARHLIDVNGTILDQEAIRDLRAGISVPDDEVESVEEKMSNTQVCITLSEDYDQSTADRLASYGLFVEGVEDTEVIGTIPVDKIALLQSDKDVIDVLIIDPEEQNAQ